MENTNTIYLGFPQSNFQKPGLENKWCRRLLDFRQSNTHTAKICQGRKFHEAKKMLIIHKMVMLKMLIIHKGARRFKFSHFESNFYITKQSWKYFYLAYFSAFLVRFLLGWSTNWQKFYFVEHFWAENNAKQVPIVVKMRLQMKNKCRLVN